MWETCIKFQRKVFKPTVVEGCQSFKIFRKNTSFLESSGTLSKLFLRKILHYLIIIIKL